MTDTDTHKVIIAQLERLNAEFVSQNSFSQVFTRGVIYGVGWVIGSAIIATIILGIVGPFVGEIPWVHDTFQAGAEITR